MVVLVSLNVEKADDALSGDSGHETLAHPDGVEQLGVTGNGELDLAVRDKLLGQVQFELDQQKVRSDHDHTVFLLIEQDVLDGAWDLADLRAIFQVVSEANRATVAAKKEKGVDVVNVGVLVDHQRAEDDLSDGARAGVLAHRGHATMRAPHSNGTIAVTRDHA